MKIGMFVMHSRHSSFRLFYYLVLAGLLSGCWVSQSPSKTETSGTAPASVNTQVAPSTPITETSVSLELPGIQASLDTATGVVWLPGDRFAIAGEKEIALLEVPTGEPGAQSSPVVQAVQASNNARFLNSSQNGGEISWVTQDTQIEYWSPSKSSTPILLRTANASVTGLAFNTGGNLLAYATLTGEITGLDSRTKSESFNWKAPTWLSNISISPDGSLLGGVDLGNFLVYIYQMDGNLVKNLQWSEHASPALYSANFSPDWNQIAWVARGTVQLMDVKTGALGSQLSHEDFVIACSWSADSQKLATAAPVYSDDQVRMGIFIWDPNSGEKIGYFELNSAVRGLSFSPDSQKIAVLDEHGVLKIVNILS